MSRRRSPTTGKVDRNASPLDDPRLTEVGRRHAHGPYEERVERVTKQIMAQVQRCDLTTDEEGFCPCARTIMRHLQRAYDEPAPPLGEMAPPEDTDG